MKLSSTEPSTELSGRKNVPFTSAGQGVLLPSTEFARRGREVCWSENDCESQSPDFRFADHAGELT